MKPGAFLAVAVLAAASAHCGGAADGGEASATEPPPRAVAVEPPEPVAEPREPVLPAGGATSTRPVALAASDRVTPATSTARGDGGVSFVTGVFSGRLVAGPFAFDSRGAADVFVARIEPDGAVAWARAVGGRGDEREPGIRVEDDRVHVVALTRDEVDCGGGALNTWSTEMFFVCVFDLEGRPVEGGAFPTGEP